MPTSKNKFLSSFLILCLLLLQVFVEAASDNVEGGVTLDKASHRPKINCAYACARRCRESSRKKMCTRACGTCCLKCQCVPPGTYGNKSACPCYASLRTHGKKPKCP